PARARSVEVVAPLPDVAVHVVQPELVRGVRTHRRRPPKIGALRRLARGIVAVEVGLRGGEVVGRLVEVEVERAFLLGSGPTPTGIFPFRLTRQAVQPSTSLLLL